LAAAAEHVLQPAAFHLVVAVQALDRDLLAPLAVVAQNLLQVQPAADLPPFLGLAHRELGQDERVGEGRLAELDQADVGAAGIADDLLDGLFVGLGIKWRKPRRIGT
jgi:hypothetical protein